MKWVELIRVRSSRAALEGVMPELEAQVKDIEASLPDAEPHFLQHAIYDGDLAVVVVWRVDTAPAKTRAGLMVAATLEKLGNVDHAVWIPTGQAA